MDDSPNDNEAQDRLKLMIQVRANNGETVASRKRVSGYEGTRGSVMLNGGPVNKNCHKEAQKPQMFPGWALHAVVVLSEPRDDREAFAVCHW